MTRVALRARMRARLRSDERGFTIIESVIAVTIIFASLTALAYTATIGFKTMAYARERVTATGLANQIMEEVRGLAYTKITSGLSTADSTFGTDTRIVNCSGTYKFENCLTGETIISTSSATTTTWINPHSGTVAASSTTNNIAYSWGVYVTNNSTSTNPYRVTVAVTWTSAVFPNAANSTSRVQSLFWSPSGCVSSSTHPFAAPCQPFFYGEANVPQAKINMAGTITGLTFTSGFLAETSTVATEQTEQVSQLSSSATESGVSATDATSTRTEGGNTATSTAADTDPALTASTYQDSGAQTGTGGTVTSPSGGGTTQITFTSPASDTYQADAATSAGGTSVCPPPTDTAQTDSLPCSGGRVQQAGSLTSVLTLNGIVNTLGTANLATMANVANNPNKSFVNREAISGQDGRVDSVSTRRLGNISLGGLPSGMTAPAGWTGYLITVVGYQDLETVQAGSTAAAPSAPVPTGSVSYWNGTGYTSIATMNSASLTNLSSSVTRTQTISGQTVVTTISIDAGSTTTSIATNRTPASGSSITDADATITPFICNVSYVITVNGVTSVDLDLTLNLGAMTARSIYAAAPAAG